MTSLMATIFSRPRYTVNLSLRTGVPQSQLVLRLKTDRSPCVRQLPSRNRFRYCSTGSSLGYRSDGSELRTTCLVGEMR